LSKVTTETESTDASSWGSLCDEDKIIQEILGTITPRSNVYADIGARWIRTWNNGWKLVEKGWRAYYYDVPQPWYDNCGSYRNLEPHIPEKAIYILQPVTPENVNCLIPSDVSVLSIDVDGNDYHIWKALKHKPDIVIIEIDIHAEGISEYRDVEYHKGLFKKGLSTGPDPMIELGKEKGYKLYARESVNLIFTNA
jgi:hypothetical protein